MIYVLKNKRTKKFLAITARKISESMVFLENLAEPCFWYSLDIDVDKIIDTPRLHHDYYVLGAIKELNKDNLNNIKLQNPEMFI